MQKKKVNLGSGTDYLDGWINVDVEPFYHPDVIADLHKPFPFSDASITEIKASDILEHFTKEDGEKFLRECHRVLKVGGTLFIRSHDVFQIVEKFSEDPLVMMHFLYGNTEVTGIFGAHKYAYTKEYIHFILRKIGFRVLTYMIEDTNFVVTAQKIRAKNTKLHVETAFKRDADVLLLSGGLSKIVASVLADIMNIPVVWLELDETTRPLLGNNVLSKILFRLTGSIPKRVILPDKETATRYMMHTRISLSKIVLLSLEDKPRQQKKKRSASDTAKIEECVRDAVILHEL